MAVEDQDSKSLYDLVAHDGMCKMMGIQPSTGYDWLNPKSKRYKERLARLAIDLSEGTVRFRRGDILEYIESLKRGNR